MPSSSIKHNLNGVEILVRGTVQGVGFRPFIYNLASRFEISGTVANTGDGVVIKAIAQNDRLNAFIKAIEVQAPPLATISSVTTKTLSPREAFSGFTILSSQSSGQATTAIPPDIALCNDCHRELFDPANRRYHYPFINCTNCGPRLTIVETIPYDRPKTSMRVFPMCTRCEEEYHDPTNRRFHAQPNACPDCGPALSLVSPQGEQLPVADIIGATVDALASGKIVAIRGLGGFHLAVDASSEDGVSLLRRRKGRPDKPLAIMAKDLDRVASFCHLKTDQKNLLTAPNHPIVLLRKKELSLLAPNLAPGIDEIGVMLPYTPLHHLLLGSPQCPCALVMTSGNLSAIPICTANDDALARLAGIADLFLLHNREIVTRVDDSVIRPTPVSPLILRRARGYAPAPIEIPYQLPPSLGCGPGLKNTFSLGREHTIVVSQHIGDLDNLEVYDFYRESIDHLQRVLQLDPSLVACDLHPDYLSTRYAEERNLPLYRVQHHHAHAVAVMAEHNLTETALAVILDGTGLGDDQTVWGGEILLASATDFKRLGHLSHLRLPGGDAAAVEPWRMGLAALFAAYGEKGVANPPVAPLTTIPPAKRQVISSMLSNNFNAPLTSSCGRLFDAMASLLGLRQVISYEGQAAMELEAAARKAVLPGWAEEILNDSTPPNSLLFNKNEGKVEICTTEFVKVVVDGLGKGRTSAELALQFHVMLIASITRLLERFAHQTRVEQVVLSGGCMQNSLLLEGLSHTLHSIGLQVFTGNRLPVNDGAVSFGQTIIGGLRHVSRHTDEGHQDSR